jgi:hypothetical protein
MRIPSRLSVVLAAGLALPFAGCNLFSKLSSPSNDAQHLVAARICLDRGDYDCALRHYQALSDAQNDIRTSETSLTRLAQMRVFSFSDLIGSLGSSNGSGSSFVTMANDLARRNAATEANRLTIREIYVSNDQIGEPSLRAFSKFIAALSMVNGILAEIAGADQTLTAEDLVLDPANCDATSCLVAGGSCTQPLSSPNQVSNSPPGTDPTGLDSATGWDGIASLKMLLKAASEADTQMQLFRGGATQSGIFDSINALAGLGAAADDCIRHGFVSVFGLR